MIKNNMSYDEAVELLKYYERIQRNLKLRSKVFTNQSRVLSSKNKLYMNANEDKINLVLSIIHAHKTARKLYGTRNV